jgi:hypothetical protein
MTINNSLPVLNTSAGALRPDASALRRVLRRARDGVVLNVDKAAIAMTARGEDLVDLCASAARVRDAGLKSSGRRGASGRLAITYSRKVFIPVYASVPGPVPLLHICGGAGAVAGSRDGRLHGA